MGNTLHFSLFLLGFTSGSERKKTSGERPSSRREGWVQIPAGPMALPVCPAPRLSPAGRVGTPTSLPPATWPRAPSREPVEGLQAEPPRRSSIFPQTYREQSPESQTVGVLPLLSGANLWTVGPFIGVFGSFTFKVIMSAILLFIFYLFPLVLIPVSFSLLEVTQTPFRIPSWLIYSAF